MKAPAFWNDENPGALTRMLGPLAFVYGSLAARRMARPGARVGIPVITIGNFVAGGAGKTPTALAIARLLIERGVRPAFLSRGYGGSERGPVRVQAQSAREIGDEPLLLARVAPTFVGADRAASARMAIDAVAPDVLVLDDGLQSRGLEPDIAIAVVDGEAGIGNGLCMPAGPLRAPLAIQLRCVDAIVIVGMGKAGARVGDEAARAGKPVFQARLEPDEASRVFAGRRVVAFAGTGRPDKFFATLEALGARTVAARAFDDHHAYSEAELESLARLASSEDAELVTTEKDLARLGESAQRTGARAVAVRLAFEEQDAFCDLLTTRAGLSGP